MCPDEDLNARYTGQWLKESDTRQGFGSLVRANGEQYEGFFVDNKFQGKGKFSFAEEDPKGRKHYVGHFEAGKFHGFGIMTL